MKRATVTWIDSASTPGWQETAQKDLFVCETTGYIVHKDRSSVVMALSRALSASSRPFGDTITIPMSTVQKIKRVK